VSEYMCCIFSQSPSPPGGVHIFACPGNFRNLAPKPGIFSHTPTARRMVMLNTREMNAKVRAAASAAAPALVRQPRWYGSYGGHGGCAYSDGDGDSDSVTCGASTDSTRAHRPRPIRPIDQPQPGLRYELCYALWNCTFQTAHH